nr:LysR family transcriptional regulator [Luteolibacter marinus]
METFVRLADCGSFSEVARAQKISQPAASLRVAKLENSIGLRLFSRHPDGLQLTRDGAGLLEQARRILVEHRRLGVRMERLHRESSGAVKVMIDTSIAGGRIRDYLRQPANQLAPLEIVGPGTGRTWDEALRQDEVDLVITGTFLHAGDQPQLQRYDLEHQKGTTLAWNPAYFDFDTRNFRFPEALRSTILIPGERLVPGYQPFLERWCLDSYGALPPDVLVFDDEAAALESCCVGLGVMIFPGDAERRMSLEATGLGVVKTFEFLLPDAYSYSIFVRAGEKHASVLKTAIKIAEIYPSLDGMDRRC